MKRRSSFAGLFALLGTAPLWLGASECEVAVVSDHEAPGDGDGDGDGDGNGSCNSASKDFATKCIASTCEYDGKKYGAGATFPDSDGCNTCTCEEDGSVGCTLLGCSGGDTCDYGGKTYKVGDSFPDLDLCNDCSCEAGGAIACTGRACPDPVCTHEGKGYAEGESYKVDCNSCTCGEDGKFSCTFTVCEPAGGCTLGSGKFAVGESVICADGCNQCGCDEQGWSSTDAACEPLQQLELCKDTAGTVMDLKPLYLEGEALAVEIGYGGGCETHSFKLCYDGSFLESNPVQAAVYVVDLGPPDPCDAWLTDQLVFDITPMRRHYEESYQTDQGTVRLQVGSEEVRYEFGPSDP